MGSVVDLLGGKSCSRLLIEIEEISSFDRFKSANISGIIEFSKA